MADDIAQYIGWAGAFTASVIAGVMSRRAQKGSDSVKKEMEGPGDEPSIRDLIKNCTAELAVHRSDVAIGFKLIHDDVTALKDRIISLETVVFTEMRGRVAVLEGAVGVLTGAAARLVNPPSGGKTKK